MKQSNKLNNQLNWNNKNLKLLESSLMYLVQITTYIKCSVAIGNRGIIRGKSDLIAFEQNVKVFPEYNSTFP